MSPRFTIAPPLPWIKAKRALSEFVLEMQRHVIGGAHGKPAQTRPAGVEATLHIVKTSMCLPSLLTDNKKAEGRTCSCLFSGANVSSGTKHWPLLQNDWNLPASWAHFSVEASALCLFRSYRSGGKIKKFQYESLDYKFPGISC